MNLNKSLFLFFIFAFSMCFGQEYFLSIVAITKDEHEYLEEWIDYHLKVGVDHFYIYDNNEHDLTFNMLEPYIEKGIVEYTRWSSEGFKHPFWFNCQPAAYRDGIAKAAGHSEWLAIIDTDEFILPMEGNSLKDILHEHYANYSTIFVNWRMFGTSGIWGGPGTSMLRNLTSCSLESTHFNLLGKTIARPETILSMHEPHHVDTNQAYANGSGVKYNKNQQQATKFLRINHYMYRDEYFLNSYKIKRWKNDDALMNDFKHMQERNKRFCKRKCSRIIEVLGTVE